MKYMKKYLLLVTFLILPITTTFAQGKRPLTVDDYFVLKDVSDVQISPDGKWVAYVAGHSDESKDEKLSNIYLVPISGGDPVQATFSGADEHPRWSSDNRFLGFLSDRNKKTQVYLLNRSGGEAFPLTDIAQGIDDFEWSPDGKKLLLVLEDPDPDEKNKKDGKAPPPYVITRPFFKFDGIGYIKNLYKHLYVFDVATRALKQITFGPYDDANPTKSDSDYPSPPRWSPDGKQILFVSNRTKEPDLNTNSDLYVVSADGGEPKQLTTNEGPDQIPNWSPDGKTIVYVTSLEPKYLWFDQLDIATIPATGGKPQILTTNVDRNTWNPTFGTDGQIYFLIEDSGTQRLVRMPANGGSITDVTTEKVVYDYDVRGGIVVYEAVRPDLPGDVFALNDGKSKQLTRVNEEALKGIELGTAERIRFTAKDGTPVGGFVTKPPGFEPGKKYPAILWIHGGPNEQETDEFYFRTQFLASRGYVIIGIDYRGSTGYGAKFQKEIFSDWGNKEVEDLMTGLDYIISQGYVDAVHIGVGGHSYGAILTNYLIPRTERFKAAITDAGESNYLMNYGVDQYLLDWEAEVGKPWENPQRYIELSPYFRLKSVKTPTLVVCGQEDWNVPLVNSEQLYLSLLRLGVETMLLVYPEQSHSFSRPSYVKDRYQRYAAWFDHFLKGALDKVPASKP